MALAERGGNDDALTLRELEKQVQADPKNLQIGHCPTHGQVLKRRDPVTGAFLYSCRELHERPDRHLSDTPPGRDHGIDR